MPPTVHHKSEADDAKHEPQQTRRRAHSAICRCGSVNVVIDTTRTRGRVLSQGGRLQTRKQYCRCLDCGRKWRRVLRIQETVINP